MSDRVIGLDIGSGAVKAAQVLRRGDSTFVVEKLTARALPRGVVADGRIDAADRGLVAQEIRSLVEAAGFNTNKVIFGLNSSSSVFMKEIVVPPMSPKELDKAIPLLLDADGASTDDSEMSYQVVGPTDPDSDTPGLRVQVWLALRDYVTEVAEVVEHAGLDVVGADLNALAQLRAMEMVSRPEGDLDAVVDIGAGVVTLTMHDNGVPVSIMSDTEGSGQAATNLVANMLALDPDLGAAEAEYAKITNTDPMGPVHDARSSYAAALARRVSAKVEDSLRRTGDHARLAHITLVGGGALTLGVADAFAERFPGVPHSASRFDPTISASDGGQPVRFDPATGGDFQVAIGLGTGKRL